MYDIVIVGAGPAGATLARLLDKRFKVMILEKRYFDNEYTKCFEKCCGGLLAPDAQKTLAYLGLGVPKDVLVGPQLFTVKTIDFDNNLERFYQRHYLNIDRYKFDKWLISQIPDNVECKLGAHFKRYRDIDGNIELDYVQNGIENTVKTRYLVGADGGFSTIRKQLSVGAALSEYASIQEWYKVKNAMPYFTTIFDKEVTDYYSWTIPKEEMLILGTAIPCRDNVNNKFKLLKQKLINKGFPLEKCIKREGAYIIRPDKSSEVTCGKDNVLLIGESGGFISPSSSEGFSYAMRCGLNLANCFNLSNDSVTIKEYKKKSRALKNNILIKNMKVPFMYNRLLRKSVMMSGVLSMRTHSANSEITFNTNI